MWVSLERYRPFLSIVPTMRHETSLPWLFRYVHMAVTLPPLDCVIQMACPGASVQPPDISGYPSGPVFHEEEVIVGVVEPDTVLVIRVILTLPEAGRLSLAVPVAVLPSGDTVTSVSYTHLRAHET